jgi:hypothetical protein
MTKEPKTPLLIPRDTGGNSRILGRLRSSSLDRQLASGVPPGWSRSLATRARFITSPERCRTLAEDWEHLLRACRRPAGVRTSRVPLCRDRILVAEAEIRDMLAALSEARLESAAGVAMASLLLGDGTGPLYDPRCTTDLAAAIQDVTGHIQNSVRVTKWEARLRREDRPGSAGRTRP